MNYDRFLTRVFDKQEKKMIYPGDEFNSNHYGNSPYELVAIDSCGLITLDPWKHEISLILFSDRYVPMQCWGLPDKNKKLIYDDDIIKFENDLYRCVFNGFAFGLSSIKEACNVLVPTTLTRNKSEIIGSYWEHPEILEAKA